MLLFICLCLSIYTLATIERNPKYLELLRQISLLFRGGNYFHRYIVFKFQNNHAAFIEIMVNIL